MGKTDKKAVRRRKIQWKIRSKISGTAARPRLNVFRSNKEIYAQLIDDSVGATLVAASSRSLAGEGTKIEISKKVGAELASKASSAGIANVVFDRAGYLYHGRVKALAEGAREGGLNF